MSKNNFLLNLVQCISSGKTEAELKQDRERGERRAGVGISSGKTEAELKPFSIGNVFGSIVMYLLG